MMKKYIFMLLGILPIGIFSQEYVKGNVFDQEKQPMTGVNVYWEGTSIGVSTNDEGGFTIKRTEKTNVLIISYIGFETERLTITSSTPLEVILKAENNLDEVVVTHKRATTIRAKYQIANLQTMSSGELLKAACCNLSESFSTNPSIDVNFSDAVTGNKQIKMLGLTSPYILMAEENIPTLRGALQAYGMSFVPGTWIESIQITKGAGSVINGYESISGQINYEFLKPATDIPFFLNLYGSQDSRFEINAHLNHKISPKLSTSILTHGNITRQKNDHNHDGFLDMPIGNQINVLNRWQYTDNENGWVSFLNLNYMKDERQAGQLNFDPSKEKKSKKNWGSEIDSEKLSVSNKIGYVFPDASYKSFGFQNAFLSHRQNSYFGMNQYDIHQKSWYSNLLYNSIISNTKNKFATGFNIVYDDFYEWIDSNFEANYSRIDKSIGVFFEYTYDNLDNLSLVAGVRADSHNHLGNFITPRFHLRYIPWNESTLRISAGRGKRMANIFAENQHLFISNRDFNIIQKNDKIYGLNPEIAWNYGISFLQSFHILNRKAELVIDWYGTSFENQVVIDLDNSPQQVWFYDLEGKSFANSFQAEFSLSPIQGLDVKSAYKYYDVKTQYIKNQMEKPLTPKHRFFVNIGYETEEKHEKNHSKWKFDLTYNWVGKQRLPSTKQNPTPYRLEDYAPSFGIFNAQITKVFSHNFEIYLGGENIGNYKQDNGILAANDPFGSFFDATMLYAPAFGRMIYGGLRLKIRNFKH
ncbi:carboxypeptidase-like regulatory domain-containing protein [Capnocytophaga canis]|uniref:carboxypeptidase-like regulatory domain-containing protein n=1 Tax=Capnocytophaga canis TaxID=1848903 RepID=UPI0015622662